uniref:C2H2-type domain-containing protein n=1 Tax=Anopheles albimanus TaxID=7167 RepID=A0A182FAG5_ANOAL
MQPTLDTVLCKCCGDTGNNLQGLHQNVTVNGKELMVRKMFEIFLISPEICLLEEDVVCEHCLQQLKFCYQFYDKFLETIAAVARRVSTDKVEILEQSVDDVPFGCSLCEASFGNNLDLEKHRKILHSTGRYYYCAACEKYFITKRGMMQHTAAIHRDASETFSCDICQRSFTTRSNYQNHMRYHKDYVCNFCNTGWLSEASLLQHVSANHADRLFVCPLCDRKDRLRKTLNRHVRSSHQRQSCGFFCGYCGIGSTSYDNLESLNEHLRQHEEENVQASAYEHLLHDSLFVKELPALELPAHESIDKEQEAFLQNVNLTRTTQTSESSKVKPDGAGLTETRFDQKTVLEDFLDEAFENNEIWEKYIENGEEYLIDDYDFYLKRIEEPQQESGKYPCPHCSDRAFPKQFQLMIHLAEQHDIASLVCNDCGASFASLQSYRTHRREHMKENVRFRESNIPEVEEALSLVHSTALDYTVREEESCYRFTCSLCDRSFLRKHNLEKHACAFYKRHQQETGERPTIRCQYCDFQSHQAKEVFVHQRKHQEEGQESIYCTLCDRRFSSTSGLKYHLKRHTGIKAFTCLYCGKNFTANSNLNAHIRNVHSDHKSFGCPECEESFASKDHLNKHQRSRHRQERSFVCGDCGKAYFQRSHLNEHVAACHREYRYRCHVCNNSYATPGSLKRHQQQKHRLD